MSEWEFLKRHEHPNFLTVLQTSEEPTRLYYQYFPYRKFENLAWIPDYETRVIILIQLCRGLSYLHSRGLVHGELSPESIILKTPIEDPDLSSTPISEDTLKFVTLGGAIQPSHRRHFLSSSLPSKSSTQYKSTVEPDQRNDLGFLGRIIALAISSKNFPAQNDLRHPPQSIDMALSRLPAALQPFLRSLIDSEQDTKTLTAADVIDALNATIRKKQSYETPSGIQCIVSSAPPIGQRKLKNKLLQQVLQVCDMPVTKPTYRESVFLIHGPEGSGKTILINSLAIGLAKKRIEVFQGTCSSRPLFPFEPLHLLKSSPPPGVLHSDKCESSQEPLSRSHETSASSDWIQYRKEMEIDRKVDRILNEIGSRKRVFVFEDIHRADDDSFALIMRLIRRSRNAPLVILCTFRPDAPRYHQLQSLLIDQPANRHILHFETSALREEQLHELVLHTLGPCRDSLELAHELFTVSQGNAAVAIELLEHMFERGLIKGGPYRWDLAGIHSHGLTSAEMLRDSHGERLAHLSEEEHRFLEWLSVFEAPVSPELLHDSSGSPLSEVNSIFSRLLRAGIVRNAGTNASPKIRFTQDALKTFVYESLPADIRKDAHRSIGVSYERRHQRGLIEAPEVLAYHFLRSSDKQKGSIHGLKAARLAHERGALHQAIHLYYDTYNLLDDPHSPIKYEVQGRLAKLLRQMGDLSRSETFYLELLVSARSRSDQKKEAVALTQLGRIQAERGNLVQAEAYAKRALSLPLTKSDPTIEAEIYLVLALQAYKKGEYTKTLTLSQTVQDLAKSTDERVVFGLGSNLAGLSLTAMRRFDEALDHFYECLNIAHDCNDYTARVFAIGNIGLLHLERGNLREAEEFLVECLTHLEDRDLSHIAAASSVNLSEVYRIKGQLTDSRSRLREALACARRSGRADLLQYVLFSLGVLESQLGHLGPANSHLQGALQMCTDMSSDALKPELYVAMGEYKAAIGDYPDALNYFRSAAELSSTRDNYNIHSYALSCQARMIFENDSELEVSARVQEAEECSSISQRAMDLAISAQSPLMLARAHVASGLARALLGNERDVSVHFDTALSICSQKGFLPESAKTRFLKYLALERMSLHEDSKQLLEQARIEADKAELHILRARIRSAIVMNNPLIAREESEQHVSVAASIINDCIRYLSNTEERHSFMSMGWVNHILGCGEDLALRRRCRAIPQPQNHHQGGREAPRSTLSDRLLGPSPHQSRDAEVQKSPRGNLKSQLTDLLRDTVERYECDTAIVVLAGPNNSRDVVASTYADNSYTKEDAESVASVLRKIDPSREFLANDRDTSPLIPPSLHKTHFQINSCLVSPITSESNVIGFLYFDSKPGSNYLGEEHMEDARRLASHVSSLIEGAWRVQRHDEELLLRQRQLSRMYRLNSILGESAAMRSVFRVIEAVIASECNVLISGESGTGKELAARAIHFSGRRKMSAFVPVDCGAIQDSLVESEMFGYSRGAFTGADRDKKGLFEEADGGTLFLDEITNTSTLLQAKLLRVLQSGEFRRVGETSPRSADVRIIAATNADLEKSIAGGEFREDLYYRLNVVTVNMPPLRERREDIPALADHFAKGFCEKEKISYRGIGESALRRLLEHPWPGNVRELRNAVESALILSRDGAVRREFLPDHLRAGSFNEIRDLLQNGGQQTASSSITSAEFSHARGAIAESRETVVARSSSPSRSSRPGGFLTDKERKYVSSKEERTRIEDALHRAGGDKSLAAKILGCSRMTLYRRMQKLNISYATGQEERETESSSV